MSSVSNRILKVSRIRSQLFLRKLRGLSVLCPQLSRKTLPTLRQTHPSRTNKPLILPFYLENKHNIFTSSKNMASDEDYSSFLDKANQDTGAGKATTQSKKASTKVVNTAVPKSLEEVEEYYVSEADEPFEPVSLKWDKDGLPSDGAPPSIPPE
jgi:hypothetical protein